MNYYKVLSDGQAVCLSCGEGLDGALISLDDDPSGITCDCGKVVICTCQECKDYWKENEEYQLAKNTSNE